MSAMNQLKLTLETFNLPLSPSASYTTAILYHDTVRDHYQSGEMSADQAVSVLIYLLDVTKKEAKDTVASWILDEVFA